jgi:hypothetical protein
VGRGTVPNFPIGKKRGIRAGSPVESFFQEERFEEREGSDQNGCDISSLMEEESAAKMGSKKLAEDRQREI